MAVKPATGASHVSGMDSGNRSRNAAIPSTTKIPAQSVPNTIRTASLIRPETLTPDSFTGAAQQSNPPPVVDDNVPGDHIQGHRPSPAGAGAPPPNPFADQPIAIDIKNSVFVFNLPSRLFISSMASTTFISLSTFRRR